MRVGLLRGRRETAEWISALGPRCEIVLADTLDELIGSRPDFVVLRAEPAEMHTALEAPPGAGAPTVALIGGGDGEHPATRLVAAIFHAKRQWEAGVDTLEEPLMLLDAAGVVQRCNLALARAVGRPVRELVGAHYREVLGAPAGAAEDPVAACLAEGTARLAEARFEALGRPYQASVLPLEAAGAGGPGALLFLRDAARLREDHEKLLTAARFADLGQLAGAAAHELSTPLASIALRAESLARAARDERLLAIDAFKNFPRYIETIQNEAFRCKKVLQALLEFARSPRAQVRDVDMNGVARLAADLFRHQMSLKGIELHVSSAAELPRVAGDEAALSQAVVALLKNALDATPCGGHVRLETGADEGAVWLSVGDDGVGIPADHLDRIFTPFFTTKPGGHGPGLGLSICQGVARAHGGEVRVESERGHGSRFSLVLPTRRPAT